MVLPPFAQAQRAQVVERGAADGDGIDAAVLVEPMVLHGDHRIEVHLRQLVQLGVRIGRPQLLHGLGDRPVGEGFAVHPVAAPDGQRAHRDDRDQRDDEHPSDDARECFHRPPSSPVIIPKGCARMRARRLMFR